MLNDEDAHHEKCVDNGQSESNPVRIVDTEIHQHPEADKGQKCIDKLDDCFAVAGLGICLE